MCVCVCVWVGKTVHVSVWVGGRLKFNVFLVPISKVISLIVFQPHSAKVVAHALCSLISLSVPCIVGSTINQYYL